MPRRRLRGTSQTVSIATCAARTAPRPAHRARASPTTTVRTDPSIDPMLDLISVPITGNCASAERSSRSCTSGRPLITMPAIEVNTMSSGNREKKP